MVSKIYKIQIIIVCLLLTVLFLGSNILKAKEKKDLYACFNIRNHNCVHFDLPSGGLWACQEWSGQNCE